MDDEKNQSANYKFFERKLASISIPLILNQLPSLLHIIGRNFEQKLHIIGRKHPLSGGMSSFLFLCKSRIES